MTDAIPALLLQVPVPELPAGALTAEGTLNISTEQAAAQAVSFRQQVHTFLASNHYDLEHDVIPSIEFGLRLFNAENFTGELSASEREAFKAVYTRFGAPLCLFDAVAHETNSSTARDEEASAAEKETLALAEATNLYLQRLLISDGEMPSACVRLSGLLTCLLAIVTATDGDEKESPLLEPTNRWRLRVHFRHQLALGRRAHSVFVEVAACIDAILMQPDEAITAEALLEVGHVQNFYHRRELAAATFVRAATKHGLQLEESAMMGVRTRWQKHQLVQMVLNAKSSVAVPEASTQEVQPKKLMAEKDGHDLLDRPREMPDASPMAITPLHPLDKAILLALCADIRNNNPFHGLTQHHMMTYIERLLVDAAQAPFLIQCQILLTRSRLERNRNRVAERSFMQLTELVDQFSNRRDPNESHWERTRSDYFYTVAFPSVWSLKLEYAEFCFDESLYKTALDTYEQILDWEKIIECCKKLDKRRRAESLARDLIAKDPQNPMLWVALGEATREDAHLWKAWELCGHKMAAPMRALARLALEREQYEKVLTYFDNAVYINPVFGGDWFTLGFAALKLQRWERGSEAFTRVCQIDPYDAFAWNNLASIMIRDNKLRPAFNAMSQGLRNNRRDWRMWQNYVQIGCQLREVTESTNAFKILLDLAKRQLNPDRATLERFVNNAIDYLKGNIPGTSVDEEQDDIVTSDRTRYQNHPAKGLAAEVDAADPAIPHAPIAKESLAVEEEDEALNAGFEDLRPFGDDVEMPESFFPRRDQPTTAAGDRAAITRGILVRYSDRVRELFQTILSLFVSDPDVYHCAAVLMGYLDGPMAGYRYRVKELRACQQKDQWNRNDTLFARTLECLENSATDLLQAFEEAKEAMENPAAGVTARLYAHRPTQDSNAPNDATGTQSDNTAAAHDTDAAALPTATAEGVGEVAAEVTPDAVIAGLKELQNNVKGALEASEEHFDGTASYTALRNLAARVRRGLQEAKATFV